MRRWLQKKLINFLVKHLYRFVTLDEIITQKADGLYVGKTKLEKKHIQEIKSQAQVVLSLEVYKLIQREMVNISNEHMFKKSQSFDDMVFGKAMLYCLDLIHQKLTKLSEM